jgi:hypothetical protein
MKLRRDFQNVRDVARRSFAPHKNFRQRDKRQQSQQRQPQQQKVKIDNDRT